MKNRRPLTAKEIQILALVANGHTDPEVAVVVGISQQTVKTRMKTILYKMRAKTRAQAVFNAIGDGYFLE